jgi:hypothetical protein
MLKTMNSAPMASCVFLITLVLSLVLSIFDVSDEEKSQKALPISVLVINGIIVFLLLMQMFGVQMVSQMMANYGVVIFLILLLLSWVLSLVNVTDKNYDNKSLPTMVLVTNSVTILMVIFHFLKQNKLF